MSKTDGGPAFPLEQPHPDGGTFSSRGMTLRDYFAAHATEEDIKAHLYTGKQTKDVFESGSRKYVIDAPEMRTREQAKYAYADAMLAAKGTQ